MLSEVNSLAVEVAVAVAGAVAVLAPAVTFLGSSCDLAFLFTVGTVPSSDVVIAKDIIAIFSD